MCKSIDILIAFEEYIISVSFMIRIKYPGVFFGVFFALLSVHGFFKVYAFYQSYHVVTAPVAMNLEGCIASIPVVTPQYAQFHFDTDLGKIKLTWWRTNGEKQSWVPGDCFALRLKIKPLESFHNPDLTDPGFSQHLQGLIGQAYVLKNPKPLPLPSQSWQYGILKMRFNLLNYLNAFLPKGENRGLIIDLILGDASSIHQETWKILRRTGTSHLMAISGLHLGLIAILCMAVCRSCFFCYPSLLERIALPRFLGWIAGILTTFYALIAGFSVSTQRALLMLYAWIFLQNTGRTYTSWQILKFALFCVFLWDPLILFSKGAWLSFTAVAWLIWVSENQGRKKKCNISAFASRKAALWRWLYPQVVLTLGLIPLTLFFFSQASPVGLIANLFAIPWVGWVIVPLSLLALAVSTLSIHYGSVLFSTVLWNLDALMYGLEKLSDWPGAGTLWPTPGIFEVAVAFIGLAILFTPRGFSLRLLGASLCLPLLFERGELPPLGEVVLTVLDVGQGLSVVVRTRHHVLVYDTGTGPRMGFDVGSRILTPYLLKQGLRKVDVLSISHIDQDHSGGAESLLSALAVKEIHSSDIRFHAMAQDCHAHEPWEFDQVQFRYFFLPSSSTRNNGSCVLQIISASHRILLTGDIEQSAEAELISRYGDALLSDILVVPHHGSKTSSSLAFLQTVKPRIAIVSSGRFNRFHFPHQLIKKRYESLEVTFKNTAEEGAILIH